MTDQNFRDMVLAALAEIKELGKERYDRLEKRLDSLDTRLDSLDARVDGMERDVGWIKGKLEGKQEGSSRRLSLFIATIAMSAVAIIISLIAIFNS